MKKKILIAILIILIILAGIFIAQKINTQKYNYEIASVEEYNYYIYQENDLYGIIDKDGKKVIDANYTNIVLPNPQKDVFVCYNGQKTEIINSKNEKIFTEYEDIEPIKLKSVASTLAYEKSTLIYCKDGLYGLINTDGKKITDNIYDSIENLSPTEGKMLVSKNDKYGVIDIKGNTIVKTEYDKILSDGYYTEKDQYKKSGFIVYVKTDDGYKCGYISYKGKTILDTKYGEIERINKEDDKNIYLIASENGKNGLYKNSKNIIQNEYQAMTYYDDNDIIILQKNKKYGVAKLDGKIIVEVEQDSIESKGIYLYAKAGTNNKVYDNQGNVVDINYNRTVYKTENSDYQISTILNNNITYYGIIDKEGNKLVDENYRYIEYLYGTYFVATDDNGNLGVINSNGKVVLDMKYSSLQKIKGKNIIQAVEKGQNTSEFYSSEMKEIAKIEKPGVQTENDDYIVIIDNEEKMYFDNNGNKIQDISKLKKENYPDKIGDYSKEQVTVENVYYIKKYGLQSHLQYIQEERSHYLEHLFGLINYALFINSDDKEMKRYKMDIKYLMSNEK